MIKYPETEDEFLLSEIKEWGFDYIDAQFALGFTPTEVHGVWVWRPKEYVTPAVRNSSSIPNTPVNLLVTIN